MKHAALVFLDMDIRNLWFGGSLSKALKASAAWFGPVNRQLNLFNTGERSNETL